MDEVVARIERGMMKIVIKTELGGTEIILWTESEETESVIRTESGGTESEIKEEREEAGPGRAGDRTRDIIPGSMYTISGQDVIKDISHVRGYVIRDASHKKEGVARDKTDEENKILDTEDAQETVTTDPNGDGEQEQIQSPSRE